MFKTAAIYKEMSYEVLGISPLPEFTGSRI
jgi:hypothetical protein